MPVIIFDSSDARNKIPLATSIDSARNFARKKFSSAVLEFSDKEKKIIKGIDKSIPKISNDFEYDAY